MRARSRFLCIDRIGSDAKHAAKREQPERGHRPDPFRDGSAARRDRPRRRQSPRMAGGPGASFRRSGAKGRVSVVHRPGAGPPCLSPGRPGSPHEPAGSRGRPGGRDEHAHGGGRHPPDRPRRSSRLRCAPGKSPGLDPCRRRSLPGAGSTGHHDARRVRRALGPVLGEPLHGIGDQVPVGDLRGRLRTRGDPASCFRPVRDPGAGRRTASGHAAVS